MAVMDRLKEAVKGPGEDMPKQIADRLHRGRERMQDGAAKRNEYLEFWRGNHYAYTDEKNVLQFQATQTTVRGGGKQPWRQRRSVNLIFDAVEHEVSRATQRVPSYDVAPSTSDFEDASAAELAEKVALYGHDKWRIRDRAVGAVRLAVIAEEAFAWPHWDSSIGPFIEGEDVGVGEINIKLFSGNQVYWEPGVKFDESRWHCVEYAMPCEQVEEMEGFVGGKVVPDADALSVAHKGQQSAKFTKMALVKEYLERPCPKYPNGRWLTICNERVIIKERDYPYVDGEGTVVDEPVLHRLVYCDDPDSDRGVGLVRHLLDAQRMYNWARSKMMEYAQLGLVPQAFGPPGFFRRQKITDEPGRFYEVNGNPNEQLRWRDPITVPAELMEMLELAQREIGRMAAQNAIPSQVEAGKAIETLIERDTNRGQQFLANVAEWYASVMRHNLMLVQGHYTEDRLVKIKGSFGFESLEDFRGADLRGQADVRVSPASIEPQTREQMEQKVYLAMSSGWIPPEQGLHAIEVGQADDLTRGIALAKRRIHRIIQTIKRGPEALFSLPARPAPAGFEVPPELAVGIPNYIPGTVPGWMPQPWDNLMVWKSEMEDWFQTEEAENLPPDMQEAANIVYSAMLALEARQQMEAAMQQAMMAEDQGMANAAEPQGAKPMPDTQAPPGGNPAPTRNQPPTQNLPR